MKTTRPWRILSKEELRRRSKKIERQIVMSQARGNVMLVAGCYTTPEDMHRLDKQILSFQFPEDEK